MGKTIALLQQANGRIDDYLDEFRRTMPALAKLHSALLAQFGPDEVKFNIEQDGKMVLKTLDKRLLFSNSIIWQAKRRSVTLSPEFAMQRLGGLMQTYAQLLPLIQAQDPKGIEMWNRMVVASGEPNKEKLMIEMPPPPMPGMGIPGMPPMPGQIPGQPPMGPQGAPAPMPQAPAMGTKGVQPVKQSVVTQSPNSPLNQLSGRPKT
jgi:hypothetical protein